MPLISGFCLKFWEVWCSRAAQTSSKLLHPVPVILSRNADPKAAVNTRTERIYAPGKAPSARSRDHVSPSHGGRRHGCSHGDFTSSSSLVGCWKGAEHRPQPSLGWSRTFPVCVGGGDLRRRRNMVGVLASCDSGVSNWGQTHQ